MEESAYVGTLAGITALSEMHIRWSRTIGLLVLVIAAVRSLADYRSGRTPWITSVKALYVCIGSAIVFSENEAFERIFIHVLRLNIIVMAYPPLLDGQYSIATLIVWLTMQTSLNRVKRSPYLWAYITVLMQMCLTIKPFYNQRCFGTLTLVPMIIPLLLRRPSKDVWIYRCMGMVVMIALPVLWTRSEPLEATQFRSTPVKTSWNRMEDALARTFDNPHIVLHALLVLGNVFMLRGTGRRTGQQSNTL